MARLTRLGEGRNGERGLVRSWHGLARLTRQARAWERLARPGLGGLARLTRRGMRWPGTVVKTRHGRLTRSGEGWWGQASGGLARPGKADMARAGAGRHGKGGHG